MKGNSPGSMVTTKENTLQLVLTLGKLPLLCTKVPLALPLLPILREPHQENVKECDDNDAPKTIPTTDSTRTIETAPRTTDKEQY